MKRIALLLLPVIVLAASGEDTRLSREETLGNLWQESIGKEQAGEADVAIALTARYAKEGGDVYLANLRTAWLHFGKKNHAEATRFYTAALRLQPAALSPRLGLLNVAKDKGDATETMKAGELVLAVDPNNLTALYVVAWGAFQAKSYGKADAAYRKIVTLYPEDADALSGAAWSNFYQGQKSGARQFFRRLVAMKPDYPDARKGLELCK